MESYSTGRTEVHNAMEYPATERSWESTIGTALDLYRSERYDTISVTGGIVIVYQRSGILSLK